MILRLSVYFSYYPAKCNDPKILPYLDIDHDNEGKLSGNNINHKFWERCMSLGEFNDDNDCYIFTDKEAIKKLANDEATPDAIFNYAAGKIPEEPHVFIVWLR